MTSFKPVIPVKAKPKPGSLPMDREPREEPHPAQFAFPPFMSEEEIRRLKDEAAHPKPQPRERVPRTNLQKLKETIRKAEKLRAAVRDDAFDDWVRRFLAPAQRPNEWTQSTVLYENYLKQAKDYGKNRGDMRLSKLELATETRFGLLMKDVGFSKKRRSKGWFYPVRLKQGA